MAGDLHTHSTFSDGSLEIEELPFLAHRAGLTHLAVSDHDSIACIEWAQKYDGTYPVQLLPAVELTCFDTIRNRQVHLLCYLPEITQELTAFCDVMAQRRNEATLKSMCQLEQEYPQFTRQAAQKLAKRAGVVYKTHIIRVLYELGYTDGIYKELYQHLFGKNGKVIHYPDYESVETVLQIARNTGGVLILAHPGVYDSMELAQELAKAKKIDGVEINHPRNTQQVRQQLLDLAQKENLLITGGSDFHGMNMSKPAPIGSCTTTQLVIEQMKQLADNRKNNK